MHIGVSFSSPGSRKEHVTVLEACALAQSVSIIGRRACGHASQVLILFDSLVVILVSTKGPSSRDGTCRTLRSTAVIAFDVWTLACHAVGSTSTRSPRTSRTIPLLDVNQRHVQETRRGAFQNHPWNQKVSPLSCGGHRRSRAQRRSIKKALAPARAKATAGGKREQDSSATTLCVHRSRKDRPRVDVRRPNDPERLRAVAARVMDAADL